MKKVIEEETDMLESNLRDYEDYELKKRELKTQHQLRKKELLRRQYEQMLELESKLEEDIAKLRDEYRSRRDNAN
jgi:chromatin segregation and condensation protein Rec8/ScpA/Scc1 (kleisin family)